MGALEQQQEPRDSWALQSAANCNQPQQGPVSEVVPQRDMDVISTENSMLDDGRKRVDLASSETDLEAGSQPKGADEEDITQAQRTHRHSMFTLGALQDPTPAETDKSVPDHQALCIFGSDNPVRVKINWLIWAPWFDRIILTCICISSILIAVEDPVNPDAKQNFMLNYFDYVFTAIFVAEMLLKWVALGLVLHPRAYLRNAWNVLDFVVVMGSVISIGLAASGVDVSVVRVIRVIRVLRPLRTIQRAQKLKEVVTCFIASVLNLTGISMLFLMFMFLFGVMGVQLFKGSFYFCEDPLAITPETCVGNYTSVDVLTGRNISVPRLWQRAFFNYDNIGEGLNTLFSASTGEGWPATLYRSIDARPDQQGPLYNFRPVCYGVRLTCISSLMLS